MKERSTRKLSTLHVFKNINNTTEQASYIHVAFNTAQWQKSMCTCTNDKGVWGSEVNVNGVVGG